MSNRDDMQRLLSLMESSLGESKIVEATFHASLTDDDYRTLRKASMYGNFPHEFSMKTNGDTSFSTQNPHKLAADLEKLIDSGETSWTDILDIYGVGKGDGSTPVAYAGGGAMTEEVGGKEVRAVLAQVLGNQLKQTPGIAKMYKNTRRSKTQRVDDYKLKNIRVDGVKGHLDSDDDPLAKKVKSALNNAGFNTDRVLIFSDVIMFQTRKNIDVSESVDIDEGGVECPTCNDTGKVKWDADWHTALSDIGDGKPQPCPDCAPSKPKTSKITDSIHAVAEGRVLKFNDKRDKRLAQFKATPSVFVIAKKNKHGYGMFVWDEVSGQSEPIARMVAPNDFDLILNRKWNQERFKKAGGIKLLNNEAKVPGNYAQQMATKKKKAQKAKQQWTKAPRKYELDNNAEPTKKYGGPKKMNKEAVEQDAIDTVTIDIPLLIRMLEYAKEDAQTDMDLHDAAEQMIAMAKEGTLTMDAYDAIIGGGEEHMDEAKGDIRKGLGALAILTALGMNIPSAEDTPLGQAMAKAAQSGDRDAALHLNKLDFYADENPAILQKLSSKYLHGVEEGLVGMAAKGIAAHAAKGVAKKIMKKDDVDESSGTDVTDIIMQTGGFAKLGAYADQQEEFLDSPMYTALYDYYSDEMPYGTAKGRTGEPDVWILDKLDQQGLLDQIDMGAEMGKYEDVNESITLSATADSMQELADMLKLAGLEAQAEIEMPAEEPVEYEVDAVEPELDAPCDTCDGQHAPEFAYNTNKDEILQIIKDKLQRKFNQ